MRPNSSGLRVSRVLHATPCENQRGRVVTDSRTDAARHRRLWLRR